MKWRLIGWCTLVGFMAAIAYAAQLSSGPPEKDVAYRWSSSIFGAVQYALMLGIVLDPHARARPAGPSSRSDDRPRGGARPGSAPP